MVPGDAGRWLVVTAGAKEVLMAWLLHWHQDSEGCWQLKHEWLSTRPPPNRCCAVMFISIDVSQQPSSTGTLLFISSGASSLRVTKFTLHEGPNVTSGCPKNWPGCLLPAEG